MGIFNWVQKKFNAKPEKTRSDMASSFSKNVRMVEVPKEDDQPNDWPNAFLSIGTLGNKEVKDEIETHEQHTDEDSSLASQEYARVSQDYARVSQDLPDFTMEEVKKLQEALTKLLSRKPKTSEEEKANLPLDRFLNCPSSLEVDRTEKKHLNSDASNNENENGDLSPHTKMILCKARDLLVNNKNTMKQKSFKFLLKKLFVCGGGFMPRAGPNLRDPTVESRMDKFFRTVLHKKIFSQNGSSSRKMYLENKKMENRVEREEEDKGSSDRHKWVKTDSEFIVLEI